jgi:hypothetical protein
MALPLARPLISHMHNPLFENVEGVKKPPLLQLE